MFHHKNGYAAFGAQQGCRLADLPDDHKVSHRHLAEGATAADTMNRLIIDANCIGNVRDTILTGNRLVNILDWGAVTGARSMPGW